MNYTTMVELNYFIFLLDYYQKMKHFDFLLLKSNVKKIPKKFNQCILDFAIGDALSLATTKVVSPFERYRKFYCTLWAFKLKILS